MSKLNDQKLAVKDLAKKSLCDGHLYLSSSDKRRFYVMRPGMLIDESFIKKHAPQNTIFDFTPVITPEIDERFCTLFKELKYSQFEKDQREKSVEILRTFHDSFIDDHHFLSFARAAFEEFCLIPEEALHKMHTADINLFRKSLYAASFSLITAMSNDYYDYMILRDFYNITFSLDVGLVDTHYSYYVAKACNQENQTPGSGAEWMRAERASEGELQVFLDHPKKSYQFIKDLSILSYPELAEIVLYQHELSSGKGFPRGITKALVSSWEAVVLLASSMVEIQDTFAFETSVTAYIKDFKNPKLSELPVARAQSKLCQAFQYFEKMRGTGT